MIISKRIRALSYYLSGVINMLEIPDCNPDANVSKTIEDKLTFIYEINKKDFDIKVMNFILSKNKRSNVVFYPLSELPLYFYDEHTDFDVVIFDIVVGKAFDMIDEGRLKELEEIINNDPLKIFSICYYNDNLNPIQMMYCNYLLGGVFNDDKLRRFTDYFFRNSVLKTAGFQIMIDKTIKVIKEIVKKSKLMLELN